MFKGHPKGLIVAFFANMGERFGFYTMVAIFVLFLQAKYGMTSTESSRVYGIFMGFVYFFPLLGGIIADKVLGYGKTIGIGLVVMFVGYLMLAFPTPMTTGFPLIVTALATIALGTGLFKGNLQALVGKMYEAPEFAANRDRAFTLFYMGINIGAMFAPTAAEKINNWILSTAGFSYNPRIPALANQFLKGTLENAAEYLGFAQAQDPAVTMETLGAFSERYINVLSRSYHYGFGVACISLIISMLVFWGFRKYYRHADYMVTDKTRAQGIPSHVQTLTAAQIKDRFIALGLVYVVVVFFWMSFHQSGVCMTYFARDYTQESVGKATNLWFDLFGLLPIFLAVMGAYFALKRGGSGRARALGIVAFVVFVFVPTHVLLQALYLSGDHWFRSGRLGAISIDFYNAGAVLFGVKDYVPALMAYIEKYDATLHFQHRLPKVDGPAKTALFARTAADGTVVDVGDGSDLGGGASEEQLLAQVDFGAVDGALDHGQAQFLAGRARGR